MDFFDKETQGNGTIEAHKYVYPILTTLPYLPGEKWFKGDLLEEALLSIAGYVDDHDGCDTVDQLFARISAYHPWFNGVPSEIKKELRDRIIEHEFMPNG